jgi:hypothetical protein
MSGNYRVRVPSQLFAECRETKQDRVWVDDRGVTFAVKWNPRMEQPLVAAIDVPDDLDPSRIWWRETPQPEHVEH